MSDEPASAVTGASLAGGGVGQAAGAAYRVLARKYRPTDFDALIGQEALVRTLTNAIRSGRLAHAWLLTGVRGVGKTTTARIIARALNCVGPDGKGGPTSEPCGVCQNCVAISEDRHVDVLEMDAASRTGVDDVRELIEGVRYRPVSARYKIYIIDEVHMLSNNAFNALLKTLEEPPEHVKFVFATTESRKIPITVLSRCQRFDLRRVDEGELATHLGNIARKEGVEIEPAALALVARAADGSVRDGLSILDQAIAHGAGLGAESGSNGAITEAQVREMLGLADRTRVFDLFETVMKGDIAQALAVMAEQHAAGADAATVIEDLLELVHWITRIKVAPEVAKDVTVPEAERVRGRQLADSLGMPSLARAWQMLLKGLQETQIAPNPMQAAEMILVRLAHAAELPPPADLVKSLTQNGPQNGAQPAPAPRGSATSGPAPSSGGNGARAVSTASVGAPASSGPTMSAAATASALAPRPVTAAAPQGAPMPQSFREVAALFDRKREGILCVHLVNDVHLVRFEPGRIEFRPEPTAPRELASRMGLLLNEWTGQRWIVSVSQEAGEPTLAEQDARNRRAAEEDAARHPFVRAALAAFPGARIVEVRSTALANPAEALPATAEGFDGEVPLTDEAPPSDEAPLPDENAYGGAVEPEYE